MPRESPVAHDVKNARHDLHLEIPDSQAVLSARLDRAVVEVAGALDQQIIAPKVDQTGALPLSCGPARIVSRHAHLLPVPSWPGRPALLAAAAHRTYLRQEWTPYSAEFCCQTPADMAQASP